jgi:SNF2 family DNA or RNA helicase
MNMNMNTFIKIDQSRKLHDKQSAFVSFSCYNKDLVERVREYPFRYYDVDTKTWEIPASKASEFSLFAAQFGTVQVLGGIEIEQTSGIPDGFTFKTKPFKHQLEGVNYGMAHDNWFLGDQMGLGKSKQVIDIAVARKLKYGYKHCLIVCGVNTLKWNWVNEVRTHSNERCWILGQKYKKNKISIGSNNDKLTDLQEMLKNDELPYFIITNVESFRNETFAKTVSELCKENLINMCVADEIHKMKNPQSQQTKGFLKCQPKCKIAMTGTPVMNNPLDLYVILKWLGYESHAFYAFKMHYCVFGGFGGYEIVGYKNMNQLYAQIQEIMLRRLKEEVFDLPDKVYIDEFVDMTPKQEIIYKEVESDIKAHIDTIKFDNNPLSTLIRLRQATGYTGILSNSIKESSKLDRMEDIIDEAVANNQQVLVFSNWTQMTDIIYNRLHTKYTLSLITGDTNDSARQANVEAFQTGQSKIIIGTIGAMGTGLTLTAGTVVIFVDEPWNAALFEQAVDRAHRIGTKNKVTIYSIMCKGTIDERIHDLIYRKGKLSDTIIDGKIVGDKTAILNYLLG